MRLPARVGYTVVAFGLLIAVTGAQAQSSGIQASTPQGDPARGQLLFQNPRFGNCAGCHEVQKVIQMEKVKKPENDVKTEKELAKGPGLYGFWGERPGSRDGYQYSKLFMASMKKANLPHWDERNLRIFLQNKTDHFLDIQCGGNRIGYANERAILDVMAYLKKATALPKPTIPAQTLPVPTVPVATIPSGRALANAAAAASTAAATTAAATPAVSGN